MRADDGGANCNAKRLVRMKGTEFLRRFLLNVLPTGVERIRHYGVLASACKGVKLPAARLALPLAKIGPKPVSLSNTKRKSHAIICACVCVPNLQTPISPATAF